MERRNYVRNVVLNGRQWLVNNAEADYWDTVEIGFWEPHTFNALDRFLDDRHSYVDVGAWIGPTLLYASHLARHCYGLEPDPVAFARLRENVFLNPQLKQRITLYQQCLATSTGLRRLGNRTSRHGGDSMSSTLYAESQLHWDVPSVTLQDFVACNGIQDCSFIKMDIEGGEFEVIPAIADYLSEYWLGSPESWSEPAGWDENLQAR